MKVLLLLAFLPTLGCTTVPEPRLCDATRAGTLIGSPATASLGTQVLKLTGARALRWIQPGTMVTMDYRADRLNIRLDANNRITKIDCG